MRIPLMSEKRYTEMRYSRNRHQETSLERNILSNTKEHFQLTPVFLPSSFASVLNKSTCIFVALSGNDDGRLSRMNLKQVKSQVWEHVFVLFSCRISNLQGTSFYKNYSFLVWTFHEVYSLLSMNSMYMSETLHWHSLVHEVLLQVS